MTDRQVPKFRSAWIGRIGLLILAVAAAIGFFSTKQQTASENFKAAQVEAGGVVYAQNCATCHGASGEGQNPEAPTEPGPDGIYLAPPHNENGHTWHHDDSLLIGIIRDGSDYPGFATMPAFGESLSDEEIESVLAYIKTFWTEEQRQTQSDRSDGSINDGRSSQES